MTANPLERWFDQTDGRLIRKWTHYFDIYHRHFEKFRGKYLKIVEFGVSDGGSAQMWREYFGPRAKLYGVDIDPRCKKWETPWFEVHIGDQADREFLHRLGNHVGKVDVLIDDGGHLPDQQIATFEEFYPRVKPGGVYLVEDLHTSYWPTYRGGLNVDGTFMEYSKSLVDELNAFHSRQPDFKVVDFTETTRSMHYYDSILVFEKEKITKPWVKRSGVRDWDGPNTHEVALSPASRLRSAGTAAFEKVSKQLHRAAQRVTKRN